MSGQFSVLIISISTVIVKSVFSLVDVDKWLQATKDNLTSQDKQNLRAS